jgi:lantibiotic modifying enzyme
MCYAEVERKARSILAQGLENEPTEVSFLSGHMSSLLLFALDSETPRPWFEKQVARMFAHIQQVTIAPNYVEGLAGFGWSVSYLCETGLLQDDIDLSDLDRLILKHAEISLRQEKFDLFYGAVGYGAYLLQRARVCVVSKRMASEYSILLCAQLNRYLDKSWSTQGQPHRVNVELGLSHGLAGVLMYLVVAYEELTTNTAVLKTLRRVAGYLVNSIRWAGENPRIPDEVEHGQPLFAPFRWCRGHLGITYALAIAVPHTNSEHGIDSVHRLCEPLVALPSPLEHDIRTAVLCHGSLGVALTLEKIGEALGKTELLESAKRWTAGCQHYLTDQYLDLRYKNHERSVGILCGLEGIALYCATRGSKEIRGWERALFLK